MFLLLAGAVWALAVTYWVVWRLKRLNFFRELGIPGPEPSFLFGNLWQMYTKGPIQCQQEWTKKYGRIFGYYYGANPILMVTDIDLMKEVLVKKFGSFTDRPMWMTTSIRNKSADFNVVSSRGHKWKQVRNLVTPAFTSGKLKAMSPLMNSALEVLMNKLESRSKIGDGFDIYDLFKGLTMDVIGKTAFGIETNVQDIPDHPLLATSKAVLGSNFKTPLFVLALALSEFGPLTFRLVQLLARFRHKGLNPMLELSKICFSVVRKRKEDPLNARPDILQMLIDTQGASNEEINDSQLEAKVEGEDLPEEKDPVKKLKTKGDLRLTDQEVTGNSLVFFLAGYETTSTALAYITHIIVGHQDVQDKLRQEILEKIPQNDVINYEQVQKLTFMDRCIMECLRIYPPIFNFVSREATQSVDIGKWTFPDGITVLIPVYVLHHDAEYWPEPEKFDPDRFLPENRSPDHSMIWQPFGSGPRNCVGMRFALTEMKLALARMLAKYKLLPSKETVAQDKLVFRVASNVMVPAEGIYVKSVPVELELPGDKHSCIKQF